MLAEICTLFENCFLFSRVFYCELNVEIAIDVSNIFQLDSTIIEINIERSNRARNAQ